MPLTIPDEILAEAQLTERAAQIEIACRLFDAGRLTLWQAARWVGLSRTEFESELLDRKIPIYRPTIEDVKSDLEALERSAMRR